MISTALTWDGGNGMMRNFRNHGFSYEETYGDHYH